MNIIFRSTFLVGSLVLFSSLVNSTPLNHETEADYERQTEMAGELGSAIDMFLSAEKTKIPSSEPLMIELCFDSNDILGILDKKSAQFVCLTALNGLGLVRQIEYTLANDANLNSLLENQNLIQNGTKNGYWQVSTNSTCYHSISENIRQTCVKRLPEETSSHPVKNKNSFDWSIDFPTGFMMTFCGLGAVCACLAAPYVIYRHFR